MQGELLESPHEGHAGSSHVKKQQKQHTAEKRPKRTYLTPFGTLVTFVVPSLLVIVYVKPTAGFDALVLTGWFSIIEFILGCIIALATLCALVYLVRAEGKPGRLGVFVTISLVWMAFWYAVR